MAGILPELENVAFLDLKIVFGQEIDNGNFGNQISEMFADAGARAG